MRRNCTVAAFAAVVVLASGGCGGGNESTVEGVVTLDGTPLERGTVSFIPTAGGAGATATIEAGGAFEARTGSAAGLQPGEYVVTVRARDDVVPGLNGAPPMPGKLLTPRKYDTGSTSDLRATINPGDNDLKLELNSNAT